MRQRSTSRAAADFSCRGARREHINWLCSVYTLHIALDPELVDTTVAYLFEAGVAGVEQRDTELVVYANERAELEAIESAVRDLS
jgi:hypothetical protein